MYTIFAILIILTSVLLVLVVLVQNPKGGGLSSSFGGGGNQIMGAKKTTDFLEKTTWTLAIILITRLSTLTENSSLRLLGLAMLPNLASAMAAIAKM